MPCALMAEEPLFSTPVKSNKRARHSQSVDLSPIGSPVDDTILPFDTDVSTCWSDEQDVTLFPSFEMTESETCEALFLSDQKSDQDLTINKQVSTSDAGSRDQELSHVSPLLISSCCIRECMLNLCAIDILKTRKHFGVMSVSEKRKWLMDRLRNDSYITGIEVVTKYIIAGKEVCKTAWCKVLPVSEKTVSTLLEQVGKGQVRCL